MSGYPLYYLPGEQMQAMTHEQAEKVLPDYGLTHMLGMATYCNSVTGGPDGGNGAILLFTRPDVTESLGAKSLYKKDRQTWRKCGKFWIGWWNDDAPGPDTLRRKERYSINTPLVLNDGNAWEFTPTSALPKAFGLDENGNFAMIPQARFSKFQEASEWLIDWLVSDDARKYTDIIDRVAAMLSLNYAVSTLECLAFGLFDEVTLERAAFYALGLQDVQKKTESEKSDTKHGDAE